MSEFKLGDDVWMFSENRRVYNRLPDGRPVGNAIYREHFYKMNIESETSRSWIVGGEKYAKSKPDGLYSKEMMEENIWCKENRFGIIDLIRYNANAEQLKQIADIVGYKEGK